MNIREPMKIEYLFLENFAYLETGLKKSSIEIDLRNSKHPINVFIGSIGSCKTFILSHLQPYATVGSLDIRNQDDPIIEGKNGTKLIHYLKGDTKYEITHEYIWIERNGSHTTKSYITKDGDELNPSGNVSSFKYIITTEFGLEQSYLRLLRIGSNVTGLLELSATERKSYVANMLESANAILNLHKKFKEELKTFNTQISILTNKLTQLESSKIDEYKERLIDINLTISSLDKDIKECEAEITKHNAHIALIAPNGIESLGYDIGVLVEDINNMRAREYDLEEALMTLPENVTVTDLAKKIGALEADQESNKKALINLQDDYESYIETIHQLEDKIAIITNDEHIKLLRRTYLELKQETENVWKLIKDFDCPYNSSYLKNIFNELHDIDLMISDINQYDVDSIRVVYNSDSSIISYSREKGEILTGRKINLSKKINNLIFSSKYVKMGIMYTPPFCPTDKCPFKRTHPYTLADGRSDKEINQEVESIKNQINKIDKELYTYAEYPSIYAKISSLRGRFDNVCNVLNKIGCVNTDNLYLVLTRLDMQKWYNYDKIIDTQELCLMKERYYDSVDRLRIMESELQAYNISEVENYRNQIVELTHEKDQCITLIGEADENIKNNKNKLGECYDIYNRLLEKSNNEIALQNLRNELDTLTEKVNKLVKDKDLISPYEKLNEEYSKRIRVMEIERESLISERNKLSVKVNDIEYTLEEFKYSILTQEYLTELVDASSAKKGIPLELINDFVYGCKDIVNDLTFSIFEDDIQIEEFKIDEKEFYVPYTINGRYIKDVTSASQGQRSLFSIAIAFAFAQNLEISYNIPLCDEADSNLHRTEHAKFLSMILRQMKAIGSIQSFLITHNSALENLPVNFIATTPEDVNLTNGSTLIKLYD